MTGACDIIQRLLQIVMETQPSFTETHALQIEQQIRSEYGGEQIKIAKRAPALRAAREKVRAEIGVKSPEALQEEHGVSRATLYRWIKK
jgi:hypothetical protein